MNQQWNAREVLGFFPQTPLSFILTLGTAYAGAIGKSIGSTAASAKAEKKRKITKGV